MKILFKILLTFFVFITAVSCKSQLVKTVNDLKKLDSNKQQFINNNLKGLLRQIKPEIKTVLANPQYGYIAFFFDSLDVVMKSDYKTKPPLAIRVYIKEPFSWAGRGKYFYLWTKKDEEEYGNLTIKWIRITGRN